MRGAAGFTHGYRNGLRVVDLDHLADLQVFELLAVPNPDRMRAAFGAAEGNAGYAAVDRFDRGGDGDDPRVRRRRIPALFGVRGIGGGADARLCVAVGGEHVESDRFVVRDDDFVARVDGR